MNARPSYFCYALLSTSLLLVGCKDDRAWPERYPTKTKVLFQGKPPVGATIALHPADKVGHPSVVPSIGMVDADGTVSFSTYLHNDGVPAGEYLVAAFWIDPNGQSSNNRLPAKYRDPKTSGHKVKIEKNINELETIELTR